MFFSNTEEIENITSKDNLSIINTNSSPFIFGELSKSLKLQISEKTLIHNFKPKRNKIQTRSQTVELKANIKELKKRNDQPNKNYHTRKEEKK